MHPVSEALQGIPGGAYAVLESITDAFYALNTDWEFTYINRQAEIVLGKSRGDLIGKSIWRVYPGLIGGELEQHYRESARDRSATSFTFYFPDHDRWYEVHVHPADIGISVYFRNVTERVRADEQLRESENRFRRMADSIPQMVWIVDASSNTVFCNRQWMTYTGMSIAHMPVDDIVLHFVHPDDRDATSRAWRDATADGRGYSVEHRLVSAEGVYRWFLARAEPYPDPSSQEIVRWFGTSTDIHESKLAESALKKSEARYRSLFESIDQGFCILQMLFDDDRRPVDYRFIEINPVFGEQTGLVDAAGKTARQLSPNLEEHWFEIYGNVALTGEAVRFENESKVMDRWFDVYAFRIDEPSEHKVALLFKDITERKQTEDRLRASERAAQTAASEAEAGRQRLDAVLDAVPVGILVADAAGALLLANAANRRLWGEHHPLAKGVHEFEEWKGWWADGSARHGQRLARHEWTMARVLRGEEALHDIIEIESFDTPPVRRIVLNSGAPIRDHDGAIAGGVVAELDITDRVHAEEALRQADRRKDEFLAMLAHELRNPLAPIAAAADLLALVPLDQAKVQQTSAVIARQVRHMTGLVDDLLDVSRVTRGLVVLNRENLDAKRILSDAAEQVRPLIEARRHRLTVQTPPDTAFVSGDQKRLVQALTNLLNNAAKYTPEGGNIVLGMAVDGAHVRITVEDNGNGMSRELVERAFDLFTQGERTSDRSQGGLGIGLALVKSLLELHGGTVQAYSDGPGKGSRFTVCLPHLDEPPDTRGPGRGMLSAMRTGNPLKVLIVDDNRDAAQMLAMVVVALGHHALVEYGPVNALERARVETPKVCLIDIGLPGMDGNELARRLRASPQTAASVMVAVTGYGQEQDREAALGAGFDHHFVKPVDTAELARLLSTVAKR